MKSRQISFTSGVREYKLLVIDMIIIMQLTITSDPNLVSSAYAGYTFLDNEVKEIIINDRHLKVGHLFENDYKVNILKL